MKMKIEEQEGIKWLEFSIFSQIATLRHAVFLRHGGKSQGSWNSLNLSLCVGDCPEVVKKNRESIKATLKTETLIIPQQVHGKDIIDVKEGVIPLLVGDALVTSQKGIALAVLHADCQAALVYDPVREVIAAVHAGWRGLVHNIYAEVVQFLQKNYLSSPSDLLVGIAPSLSPENSEFLHYQQEFPRSFWKHMIAKPFHFNLWKIAEEQLMDAGILPHRIEIMQVDTYANPELFYSYRREKQSGRHATAILLRDRP